MYTLLVTNDNTIITTIKERIVQRSKKCDKVRILVPMLYKNNDISDCEVTMLYTLPMSKEQYSIALVRSDELYKSNYLEYIISLEEHFTYEEGKIKFDLTFADKDTYGDSYFRIATGGNIEISPCKDWDSTAPYSYVQEKLAEIQLDLADIRSKVSNAQSELTLIHKELEQKTSEEDVDDKIQEVLCEIPYIEITAEKINESFVKHNLF